jgi:hypothetical protein|nr:MAG: hypothetical protein [Bacteriophage sp.]
MKSEELATQWCREHPDATLEQAFMAGLGHKMNMNKDSLSARKDKFRSEVLMYRGKYPDDMLKDFFEYWTECGGRKMRFEKERTFEVSKRLVRWSNNDFNKYGKQLNSSQQQSPGNRKESVERLADLASGVLQGIARKFD